jgi:hypothetical protein
MKVILRSLAFLLPIAVAQMAVSAEFNLPPKTFSRTLEVKGQKIFYREAGDPAPVRRSS